MRRAERWEGRDESATARVFVFRWVGIFRSDVWRPAKRVWTVAKNAESTAARRNKSHYVQHHGQPYPGAGDFAATRKGVSRIAGHFIPASECIKSRSGRTSLGRHFFH